ncbi:hypothetical protein AJ79_03900 [Helicocarpus griseus UAMH5409]|uniref:ATP-grasp domain-containing protein n=1 Tax=Helicocarpus griseus UAMH5409 TaxID=1447875 RepID=A0A2B7XW99_9EURO|nr:hypothetical protein AJ79_03900 [Helicocarpus griseus UAMH5409]
MRICVIQPSYEGTGHALEEIDTEFSDLSHYSSQHTFENRFIHKATAKEEIDAIAREGFDFHINFMWGNYEDDVAGIEESRYFESLDLPSAGIRSWERARNKNVFYEEARKRGAPPIPGVEKFPLFVKPANGYASLCIDERSICYNESELFGALNRLNQGLREGRLRVAKQRGLSDPEAYATECEEKGRDSNNVVVQEYIDGEDYVVSVIEMGESATALTPCRIRYKEGGKFDLRFENQ